MTATEATAWHSLTAEEAVERLNGSVKAGLDDAEAARRQAQYGLNLLPTARKRGPLMRFLMQFKNVLVYVLIAAGFIKLMMGLWLDASIILGVVIINGLLGFIQEGRAEKSLDSIRNMLSAEARTLRNGQIAMIPAEQLVPGDIVSLESGDKIPADIRLLEVKNLRTEEAALTGESVPSDKSTAPVSAKATVGDRACMAYSGTLVVSGRATGIVVGTGSDTELGRINQMLAGVSPLETPLLLQIKKFGYAITVIILIVSAITFAYGRLVQNIPFIDMFQAVTGIAVSMIPEGLPALITITLAIGVQRMASRNAIVRRLPAVETLGSVARICSDKTGTLTLMEMMVASAATADETLKVTGQGYASEGEVLKDGAPVGKDPVLELLGRVSALCNDAELRSEDGVWKVEGDPTEGALYPFAAKLGVDRATEQAAYPRLDVIPFESEHRFMATLHGAPEGGQILLVKGAPEVILDHCDRQEDAAGKRPPLDRAHFDSASDALAAQGERVLALAWLPDPGLKAGSLGPADLPKTLVLLGLVGLIDPPRQEAIEAVKECHAGGIRVTMITGDHKITAAAIAKMLDIGDGKTAVTGAEVAEMDMATLQETVAQRRRVRAREPGAQAAAGQGDPGQRAGGGDDRRRRQRRAGAEESRHRRRHGHQGHRGHQGGGRDGARRRQFRLDHGGGEGGAHRLQQYREGDPVHAADQRRPGAGHPGRDLRRLHHPDHRAADPVGQHGDLGRARPRDLVRAARDRRDAAPAACGQSSDPRRLRPVARRLRRDGALGSDLMGVLLDEVARRFRLARAHGRGQRAGDRPGVLSPEQPVQDRLVPVANGPSRQPVSSGGYRRGRRAAASLHLRAAAAAPV